MNFQCYLFYFFKSINLSPDLMQRQKELFSAKNTAWGLQQILFFTWNPKLVPRVF